MRIAAVQCTAGPDREDNLARVEAMIEAEVPPATDVIVLPELFSLLGPRTLMLAEAEATDGPTMAWAIDLARRQGCWLLAGSFAERSGRPDRHHNTSCLLRPDGSRAAIYRKIHLFDNDVDGAAFHESSSVVPGSEIVTASLDAGGWSTHLGLATCYDLRFPELFRILVLRGAEVVALPSAFTAVTGRAHWEPLLRARAIENQTFVVAANQWGRTGTGMECYGRSMIVDPWGEILAEAPDGEGVITADLDPARLREARTRLPSLANRRPDTYHW